MSGILRRLIYCSQVSPGCSSADVRALVSSARRRNAVRQINSVLYFDRTSVIQLLEGFTDEVNEAFQVLCRDVRHHTLHLLHYERCHRPRFRRPLALVEANAASCPILKRYEVVDGLFLPERLSEVDALRLMEDLQEIAAHE